MWLLALKKIGPHFALKPIYVNEEELDTALKILLFDPSENFELVWKCSKEPNMLEAQRTLQKGQPLASLDWCKELIVKHCD